MPKKDFSFFPLDNKTRQKKICKMSHLTCIVSSMNTQQLQIIASLPAIYLCLVSIPILITDFTQGRVPNKYTLPTIWLWLGSAITYAVVSGEWLWGLVFPFLVGLVLVFVGTYLNAKWQVIGMGDVKLFAVMGLSLSWKFAWVWLVLPFVSMAITAILVILMARFTRREIIGGRLAPFIYLVYFGLVAIVFTL